MPVSQSRKTLALTLLGTALVGCAPSARPISAAVSPQVGVVRQEMTVEDSTNLFRIGPRDGMRCNYLPLEDDERRAGLSTHLEFTIGSREALHRIVELWADTLGAQRMGLVQYRGPNWAFDTSWTAVVALSRTGAGAGLLITLPPPIVDTTVFPPSVTKGGSITAELSAEQGRLANELARWLWDGRCPPREPSDVRPPHLPSPTSHLPSAFERRLPLAAALTHPVRHRDRPRREVLLQLAPAPVLSADPAAPGTDREE